ncbi:MAG TPA: glycosyltransferase [Anaerolineae bacterium]|nr:glycosyltransferase [Anaerolineae bacterium]
MSDHRIELSVVIACYNEEVELEDSVRQVVEILDRTRWAYEIIFVDDCSRDRTRDIIDALLRRYGDQNFRKLFHEKNTGRGRTVADGMRLARGETVGYIDIDLEVHARYIPSMALAIEQGADVATAHRIYKIQPRLFNRFLLSAGYAWLMRHLLDVHLKDTETGFKFFKRASILPILEQVQDERWFWDTEVMVRSLLCGYRIVEIPCLFIRRYDKQSTVNVVRDTLDYLLKLWRFRRVVKQLRAAQPVDAVIRPTTE